MARHAQVLLLVRGIVDRLRASGLFVKEIALKTQVWSMSGERSVDRSTHDYVVKTTEHMLLYEHLSEKTVCGQKMNVCVRVQMMLNTQKTRRPCKHEKHRIAQNIL